MPNVPSPPGLRAPRWVSSSGLHRVSSSWPTAHGSGPLASVGLEPGSGHVTSQWEPPQSLTVLVQNREGFSQLSALFLYPQTKSLSSRAQEAWGSPPAAVSWLDLEHKRSRSPLHSPPNHEGPAKEGTHS